MIKWPCGFESQGFDIRCRWIDRIVNLRTFLSCWVLIGLLQGPCTKLCSQKDGDMIVGHHCDGEEIWVTQIRREFYKEKSWKQKSSVWERPPRRIWVDGRRWVRLESCCILCDWTVQRHRWVDGSVAAQVWLVCPLIQGKFSLTGWGIHLHCWYKVKKSGLGIDFQKKGWRFWCTGIHLTCFWLDRQKELWSNHW